MMRPVVRTAPTAIGPGRVAGLTTRLGFPDAGDEPGRAALRQTLGDALQTDRMAWRKQVHGPDVVTVDSAGPAGDGDGLVSDRADLVLLVTVADCCPVLLWEPGSPRHGAAHAGWRGMVGGVLENTVTALERLGADPGRLRAWIGPSIGPCCFEVGSEVAAQFPTDVVRKAQPRPYVDLRAAARARLETAGLLPAHVAVCPDCTSCRRELYFSYRRDGGICGRHLGYVRGDAD